MGGGRCRQATGADGENWRKTRPCVQYVRLETLNIAVAAGGGMLGQASSYPVLECQYTRHAETKQKTNTYLHAGRRRAQGQGQDRGQTQHGGDWREPAIVGCVWVGMDRDGVCSRVRVDDRRSVA